MAVGLTPVVVKDADGRLADALRPLLADAPVQIVEARTFGDCRRAAAGQPGPLLVLDEGTPGQGLVELLTEAAEVDPPTRVLVLYVSAARPMQQWLREAGVTWLVRKPVGNRVLAEMVRHMATEG